jgi:hypothetical protein
MPRKYLPYIALLAAALFYFWVKRNQKGSTKTNIPVDIQSPGKKQEDFNRTARLIRYSKHARCRMDCRHIDESEVKEILKDGVINYEKIETDAKGRTYPLEGKTHDGQHVRVVFAPHEDEMVVVTVIDMERDWPCNCN